MKKEGIVMKIFRCVSPMIYYNIISMVVSIPFVVIALVRIILEISQGGASEELAMENYMSFIMGKGVLMTGIVALISIPIFMFMMKRDYKRIIAWSDIKNIKCIRFILVIAIVIVAFTYCVAGNNLIVVTNLVEIFPSYQDTSMIFETASLASQLLFLGIIVPIAEELMFRGLIFKRIREYTKPTVAIWVSGIIFGAFHMNFVQFLYAGLMGVIMALVYEKTRSIMWPILIHIIANLSSLFVVGSETYMNFCTKSAITMIAVTSAATIIVILCSILFVNIKPIAGEINREILEPSEKVDSDTF